MKPRRILIFSLFYYPNFIGGAEVAVKEITDRISPIEIIFDMITLADGGLSQEKIGNVSIHRIGWNFLSKNSLLRKVLYIPLAALEALSLYRKNKYDALWSIMASYGGFAAVIFKIFYPKIPLFLTIQEGDHFERRKGILRPVFKIIFNSASRIQAISTYLANWSKDMGATCPITVIPNGVDSDKFATPITKEERQKIREECGFDTHDIVLVTSSRLVHKNGLDIVIDSLKYVPSHYKFLIIGKGEDEDKLRKQAHNLKINNRIIFKGFVNHGELFKYIKAGDIFVRPSRTEGLGNSFLEAMAARLPVIATPVGGIPDFLIDGKNGLFSEVDNSKDLADKITFLVNNKDIANSLIENGSATVKNKYNWSTISKEIKDLFLNL